MIRIGGPLPNEGDPHEVARKHVEMGYTAAYCPPASLDDPDRIRAIRDAFAAADVEIAEVPAWGTVVPPEPERRKAARDFVCDRLALADEIGARCAITYIGSLKPDSDYDPYPD